MLPVLCKSFRCSVTALLAFGVCFFVVLGGVASAYEVDAVGSEELVENPDKYDGRVVTYRGEAIGDVLKRGPGAWLTVNDGHYSRRPLREYRELEGYNTGMGVYGRYELFEDIRYLGSYTAHGDTLEIKGVFSKASQEHAGAMMITAEEVKIVRRGRPLTENHFGGAPYLAAVFSMLSLALGYIWFRRRHILSWGFAPKRG